MTETNKKYLVYVIKNSDNDRYCGFCKYEDASVYLRRHRAGNVKTTSSYKLDFEIESALLTTNSKIQMPLKLYLQYLINNQYISEYTEFINKSKDYYVTETQLNDVIRFEEQKTDNENKKDFLKIERRNSELLKLKNIKL